MKVLKKILLSNYIFLIILLIILILFIIKNKNIKYINTTSFEGTIINYTINENKVSLIVKNKHKIIANIYYKNKHELNDIKSKLLLGSKVYLQGKFYIPENNTIPYNFNYKKYLKSKNIYNVMTVSMYKFSTKYDKIFYFKNLLIKKIEKYNNKEYYYTFVFGDKTYINDEVYDSYKINGVTHLFAISGMHISLLIYILSKFKVKKSLISLFLFYYAFMVLFSASVLRVILFYIFKNDKLSDIRLLLLIMCILLLKNPFYVYDYGFMYSFIITFGILLYKPNSIVSLSIICFLLSLPLNIFLNFEINIMSLLANILIVPLVSMIIYPLILISIIFKNISFIVTFLINVLEILNKFISHHSLTIIVGKPNILIIIIMYIFIFTFIRLKKRVYVVIMLVVLIGFKYSYYLYDDIKIYYLDVKQGDCEIIIFPNKEVIVIDTGGIRNLNTKSNLYNKIINFLKGCGVSSIKYLILSHGDYDHMGEAINLVNNYKVENIVFNCDSYNYLENGLIEILNKKHINYYSCINELSIDNYKINFLNTKEYGNENDNSNVLFANFYNYKLIFMGDAGIKKEEDIINKYNINHIDFFKVGHHGSNTSSSRLFIDNIKPKYSLISVGKNNRYGHPKEEVLETLKDSKIYRTDLDGSIEIKLNKKRYKIRTCPP